MAKLSLSQKINDKLRNNGCNLYHKRPISLIFKEILGHDKKTTNKQIEKWTNNMTRGLQNIK